MNKPKHTFAPIDNEVLIKIQRIAAASVDAMMEITGPEDFELIIQAQVFSLAKTAVFLSERMTKTKTADEFADMMYLSLKNYISIIIENRLNTI